MVLPDLIGGQIVSLGLETIFWAINMSITVACLFTSLYLYVSHDDLRHQMLEPGELSEAINMVSILFMFLSWKNCNLDIKF